MMMNRSKLTSFFVDGVSLNDSFMGDFHVVAVKS